MIGPEKCFLVLNAEQYRRLTLNAASPYYQQKPFDGIAFRSREAMVEFCNKYLVKEFEGETENDG